MEQLSSLGETVGSFLRDNIWTEIIVTFLISLGLIFKNFIKSVLDRILKLIEEKLNQYVEPIATSIVGFIEKLILNIFSGTEAKYYEVLVCTLRTYRTLGLKTQGLMKPDLEKVFVPLRVSPESPEKISPQLIQPQEKKGNLSIWDFLTQAKLRSTKERRGLRIAILAPPGAGKTTLLEHITLTYAQNSQKKYNPKALKLLPIFLRLRDIRETIAPKNVSDQEPKSPYLEEVVVNQIKLLLVTAEFKLNITPEWFRERLNQGTCLVLLDSLDEVADQKQRKQVSVWVNTQMARFPKSSFLLSSRPFGYKQASVQEVNEVLEVLPFNLREVESFLYNWYIQNECTRQRREEDPGIRAEAKRKTADLTGRIKSNPPLAAMALNPLLLTMIVTVHDNRGVLPGQRAELYQEICDVLLYTRTEAKGIASSLTGKQKESVLRSLALTLMKENTREFSTAKGCDIISESLAQVAGTNIDAVQFLKQIEEMSGLLICREQGILEFAHKSFQEYLAASEIKEKNQIEFLLDKMNDVWWSETIRLFAAQSNATKLIEAVLSNPTNNSLALAYDILEERGSIGLKARTSLENYLIDNLQSSDRERYSLGAKILLKRRMNNFTRIDEKTEIDQSLITCAEYQLFLDDKYTQDGDLAPEHWQDRKFPSQEATKPIAGIRAEDTQKFCAWLTEQSWLNQGLDKVIYRLPNQDEVSNNPLSLGEIGYWFLNDEHFNITGVERTIFEKISALSATYPASLESGITIVALALDLARDRDRNLDCDDLARTRILSLVFLITKITTSFYCAIYDSSIKAAQKEKRDWFRPQVNDQTLKSWQANRDLTLSAFGCSTVLLERINGELPAWEGLRIVRQKA